MTNLKRVKSISLIASIVPPLAQREAAVHTADFNQDRCYYVADGGDRFYVCKGQWVKVNEDPDDDSKEFRPVADATVISVPLSYVKRIEYLSWEDSPMAAKAATLPSGLRALSIEEAAEAKRGPGRPRIHPIA